MRCGCKHLNDGGGGGIRTPARLSTPLGFQDRPLQPDLGTPPYRHVLIYHNDHRMSIFFIKKGSKFSPYEITSFPPIYGRSTSGMTTVPSSCW